MSTKSDLLMPEEAIVRLLDRLEEASVIADDKSEAVDKRAVGSFGIARRMTADSALGMLGLISLGGVGSILICCIITTIELLSRKGCTPVHISYKITPST